MNAPMVLALAMVLDAVLGEPDWLWSRFPHPAVVMGRVVGYLDTSLNTQNSRRIKGVIALALLMCGAWFCAQVLSLAGPVVEGIVATILLAQRSLVQHVSAVSTGLTLSLVEGRNMVARIVSRDTGKMDTSQTARAAIESAAENLSDGVIAPAFWFLLGGLPGILIYKVVNTADSMIGYRTEKYEAFGWAAARCDDLLNIVPARLTAALIGLIGRTTDWRGIIADARRHRSPNAGWPEAAMARALGIALAGPRAYDGRMQEFAWVHSAGRRTLGPADIDAAVTMLWKVWGVALGFVLMIALAL